MKEELATYFLLFASLSAGLFLPVPQSPPASPRLLALALSVRGKNLSELRAETARPLRV
jgi:hypothetical protein